MQQEGYNLQKNNNLYGRVIDGVNILINLIVLSMICALIGGSSFASPSAEGIQVYQNNVHLSPEHKQKLADDITRYRNADNLWDVLREEFTLPHYDDSPAVQAKIEWFMNNQDYLLRSASRAAPYLYYISQQVKKRHLPAELVLLPIIESGYNPFSLSNMGAEGIWQLMPSTASGLGVKQDWWYNGRRDVIASTRAALNYLAYLQSFFEGNWLYAIAAYNTGEGNVLSAIRRNIRDGRDTDFWSLPVAQQTRDYVPSLLALAVIISHPDQYPIYFPPVRNAPYLAQVDVGSQMNLNHAAMLAGISSKKIIQLNPGYNRLYTSSKGQHKLILPIENVEQFSENLARSPLHRQVNWIHYKVKSGDTFASIAKKFKSSVDDIRNMNHLAKSTVKPGTNLLIPNATSMTTILAEAEASKPKTIVTKTTVIRSKSEKSTDFIRITPTSRPSRTAIAFQSSGSYSLQPGDTVYMVRTKDTLQTIAKKFHVTSDAILAANHITSQAVKTGRQIVVPTHLAKISAPALNKKAVEAGDTIYMVRRGDTVDKIARKFHTAPSVIRLANLIDDSSLLEGAKLVIPAKLQG